MGIGRAAYPREAGASSVCELAHKKVWILAEIIRNQSPQ
jgi:hypothetical protein